MFSVPPIAAAFRCRRMMGRKAFLLFFLVHFTNTSVYPTPPICCTYRLSLCLLYSTYFRQRVNPLQCNTVLPRNTRPLVLHQLVTGELQSHFHRHPAPSTPYRPTKAYLCASSLRLYFNQYTSPHVRTVAHTCPRQLHSHLPSLLAQSTTSIPAQLPAPTCPDPINAAPHPHAYAYSTHCLLLSDHRCNNFPSNRPTISSSRPTPRPLGYYIFNPQPCPSSNHHQAG